MTIAKQIANTPEPYGSGVFASSFSFSRIESMPKMLDGQGRPVRSATRSARYLCLTRPLSRGHKGFIYLLAALTDDLETSCAVRAHIQRKPSNPHDARVRDRRPSEKTCRREPWQ